MCEGYAQPLAPQDGRLKVIAAFCAGSHQVSTNVHGIVHGVTSPKDEGFRDMMTQVTWWLMPPFQLDMQNGGDMSGSGFDA